MAMTMAKHERDALLGLADAPLLAVCRFDHFRGTGRGGQKRNRTDSSVRVTHLATGLAATGEDTRSQHINLVLALRRLRQRIAFECRAVPEAGVSVGPRPGQRDRKYPVWVAGVLDVLEAAGYRLSDAVSHLGCSTGRLVRDLAADPHLWQHVNQGRERYGLPPLR